MHQVKFWSLMLVKNYSSSLVQIQIGYQLLTIANVDNKFKNKELQTHQIEVLQPTKIVIIDQELPIMLASHAPRIQRFQYLHVAGVATLGDCITCLVTNIIEPIGYFVPWQVKVGIWSNQDDLFGSSGFLNGFS